MDSAGTSHFYDTNLSLPKNSIFSYYIITRPTTSFDIPFHLLYPLKCIVLLLHQYGNMYASNLRIFLIPLLASHTSFAVMLSLKSGANTILNPLNFPQYILSFFYNYIILFIWFLTIKYYYSTKV